MHSLIATAIADAAGAGIPRLSLAAAPMRPGQADGWPARLYARLARRRGGAGLLQFKAMFDPVWETRYIAAPGLLALARGGLSVGRAIRFPNGAAEAAAGPGTGGGRAAEWGQGKAATIRAA
jgi:phosphatidylglycerol lysyltransferase